MIKSRKIAWSLYTGAAVVEIAFVIGFLIEIFASKALAAMGILSALALGALGLIIDPMKVAEGQSKTTLEDEEGKKKDIWGTDFDFDEIKVDKELTKRFATAYRGGVRLAMGLICTKEEFEEDKKRALSRPLP
ncbi:hypothetical protein CW713_02395 [Methanophagales archaeon]|nr:MAG: hypothetical protein CW713_02395 [Methanophagales archaeon]